MGTKTCLQCAKEKPISEFHRNGYDRNGNTVYKPRCIACSSLNISFVMRGLAPPMDTSDHPHDWFSPEAKHENCQRILKRSGLTKAAVLRFFTRRK